MNFIEEEYKFQSNEYQINGSLSYPKTSKEKFPAAILIHGSGPNDRDETIYGNKPFKDIAHYLSSNGVAVLRYDKRTFTYQNSIPIEEIKQMSIKEEVIDDALNALNSLSSLPYIDSQELYLIGHSLGGWCAPLIVEKYPVKGICLIAANARTIDILLKEQIKYQLTFNALNTILERNILINKKILDSIIEEERNKIDVYFNKIRKNMIKDDENFFGAYQEYYRFWIETDPKQSLKSFNGKILILQGENDCQVSMEDFNIWKKALGENKAKNYTCRSFPNINHLLMKCEDKSTGKEYMCKSNVDKEILVAIENWIKNEQSNQLN